MTFRTFFFDPIFDHFFRVFLTNNSLEVHRGTNIFFCLNPRKEVDFDGAEKFVRTKCNRKNIWEKIELKVALMSIC